MKHLEVRGIRPPGSMPRPALHHPESRRLARSLALLLAIACGRASSGSHGGTGSTCEPRSAECSTRDPHAGGQALEDRAPDAQPDAPGDGVTAAGVDAPGEQPEPGAARQCPGPQPVFDQPSIDALEGCSVIEGNLSIIFAAADLRPLHALTRVTGTLLLTAEDVSGGLGIESLEGLESLESVSSLFMDGVSAPTLAPLRNLRSVGAVGEAGPVAGEVILNRMHNLRNLDGLQSLALDRIVLDVSDNPNLETLDPLVFPREVSGSVLSRDSPQLESLGGFGGVESIEYLLVRGSALTSLDALSSLRRARVLELIDNPILRDAQGLAGLEWSHFFQFAQHPEVTLLPDFDQLVQAGFVNISQNARLAELPSFPRLSRLSGDWSGELIVEDNPSLVRVGGLAALESTDVLRIQRNETLARIDLPSLREVSRRLVITRNPALEAASLASLAGVAVPDTKIAGNEPDAPVLDACPWRADGECDAAPTGTLCAAGSDELDCRPSAF